MKIDILFKNHPFRVRLRRTSCVTAGHVLRTRMLPVNNFQRVDIELQVWKEENTM